MSLILNALSLFQRVKHFLVGRFFTQTALVERRNGILPERIYSLKTHKKGSMSSRNCRLTTHGIDGEWVPDIPSQNTLPPKRHRLHFPTDTDSYTQYTSTNQQLQQRPAYDQGSAPVMHLLPRLLPRLVLPTRESHGDRWRCDPLISQSGNQTGHADHTQQARWDSPICEKENEIAQRAWTSPPPASMIL
jgi:hypothetical protein